jgi:nucleoside-diphosphate-sugar epimerase
MVVGAIEPGSRVVLTGPGGFVGRAVAACLDRAGYEIVPAGRHEIGEIHRATDWSGVLNGADAVVHLAARVHIMGPQDEDAYREVNLHGTANLARQAKAAGARRFIFMSTLKVLGESGEAVRPGDPPAPHDSYAVSKTEAEAALRDLAEDMALVILRPPLVHGPGVGANFETLMSVIARGVPLPFASVDNRRSLIHVDNLADAVRHALTAPAGLYHPKDDIDFSTPELIRLLAEGMGRPARLFPFPVAALPLAAAVTGRSAEMRRLTGTFTSDGAMAGWEPPIAAQDGIRATAAAYIARHADRA